MNPKTIRFNPTKDKDLIDFFEKKGLKNGVKFLYNFYLENQNKGNLVDEIVKELKKRNKL